NLPESSLAAFKRLASLGVRPHFSTSLIDEFMRRLSPPALMIAFAALWVQRSCRNSAKTLAVDCPWKGPACSNTLNIYLILNLFNQHTGLCCLPISSED